MLSTAQGSTLESFGWVVWALLGGVAIYFIPIVAMVLGITFRSEVIHPLQWAGTAVVLFSAWLTTATNTSHETFA